MMKYEYVKDIICPFYTQQYVGSKGATAECIEKAKRIDHSIKCEGVYKKSAIILEFAEMSAKKEHRDNYCASYCWGKCPIARMLNKTKYKVED